MRPSAGSSAASRRIVHGSAWRRFPSDARKRRCSSFMGWDLANIHLGSSRPRPVQEHLRKLGSDWLPAAVDTMLAATIRDYQLWKRHK